MVAVRRVLRTETIAGVELALVTGYTYRVIQCLDTGHTTIENVVYSAVPDHRILVGILTRDIADSIRRQLDGRVW